MFWQNALWQWLIHSAVFGTVILFLGAIAVWRCREPVYRIRWIEWTLAACFLVPVVQQLGFLPQYSFEVLPAFFTTNVSGGNSRAGVIVATSNSPLPEAISPGSAAQAELATGTERFAADSTTNSHAELSEAVSPTPASVTRVDTATDRVDSQTIAHAVLLAYLMIAGLLAAWLGAGAIRRLFLKRTTQTVSPQLRALFRAIAGPAADRVHLLVSNRIETPMAWGLVRPVIVVPAALTATPNSREMRWALAHEWYHVQRHDIVGLLLASIAKLVCFYQPVYWWLRRQLMLSQDYLADAYAAGHGASAEDYAEFLVELARKRVQPAMATTLGIADRKSRLCARIRTLVQSHQRFLQQSRTAPTLAIASVALVGLGLLGALRLETVNVASGQTLPSDNVKVEPEGVRSTSVSLLAPPTHAVVEATEGKLEATERTHSETMTGIHGRVVGPDGKPVAGAHVAALGSSLRANRGGDLPPKGAVLAEATTGNDGRYRMSVTGISSKTHRYAAVIARTDRAGLAWQRFDPDATNVEASFKLPAEQLIRGRLIDTEGQPASGVRMSISSVVVTTTRGMLAQGIGYGDFKDLPEVWPQPVTTDAQGRFTIRSVAAGHGVLLRVEGNDRFAPQHLALNTGLAEERGEHDETYRSQVKNLKLGEEAVVTLAPAQIFEGVVRYEDTDQPASGARLTIWASQQKQIGSMVSVAGRADSQGRYHIRPLPGVRFGVTAYPPDGVPYLIRRVDDIAWEHGTTVKQIDVALPRGVLVRGKVVESGTNAAVAGAAIHYVPEKANNPHTADDIVTGWQGIQISGEDGRFEMPVLPGPGRLLVHGPRSDYVLREIGSRQLSHGRPGGWRNYAHAILRVDPDSNSGPIDVTLKLQRGATVTGRIVDPRGNPVDEALVITRLTVYPTSLHWRGMPMEAVGGHFELSGLAKGQRYPVYFLDAKNRRGATVMLKAGETPPTIVLKPCGQATATLTNSESQPITNLHAGIEMVVTPGVYAFDLEAVRHGKLAADAALVGNIDHTNYWPGPKTDDQGHITFPALIPGATYRLINYSQGKAAVAREFTVQSRQTIELGEIVIQSGQ